jgi:hypothetical protein
MINITYAITVCNELEEITKLVDFLKDKIGKEDEILIQYDEVSVTTAVKNYLTIICKDNKGNGNMASSSLFLYFRNELENYIKDHYFLLATGPKNTDIPYLVLKVIHFALF